MFTKLFFLYFLVSITYCDEKFILKQVLMLSRHNVRTPLSKTLSAYTPKAWPDWIEKRGYLTAKGALLEGYMGEFVVSWLKKEGFLAKNCPNDNDFYVYTNTAQRTMASAQAFVSKAFPLCNITIHHTSKESDPIFNPFTHNTTENFQIEAAEQMRILLKSLHMNQSYEDIGKILDYDASNNCLKKHKCDLINDKNRIFVASGAKPNVDGPLKISNSVIDSFIMENYEGFPLQNVAWGQLNTKDRWNNILDLTRGYHNVIFNVTIIAKDIAKPLVDFITEIFNNQNRKISLLMGHDANIYTVLKSMGFKPYNLEKQYEKVPVGGKIVYQKWLEENSGVFYSKINYIYQSTNGMRKGRRLSMENPPENTILELEGCKINKNGMCPWADFMHLLNNL